MFRKLSRPKPPSSAVVHPPFPLPVDVWLAGPVAQSLDRQTGSPTDSACCNNAALFYSPQHKRAGPCSATITLLPPSSNNSSFSCCLQLKVVEGCRDSSEPPDCSAQSPLAAALQLLTNSVRLNLCSGAFLAAAVEHMPWLCRALEHKEGDLQLLQQYHRCVGFPCTWMPADNVCVACPQLPAALNTAACPQLPQ